MWFVASLHTTFVLPTEHVLLAAATNDSDINDLFSKGGSHTAQSSANPFSGPRDSGSESSGPQDSNTRSSGPADSGARASGQDGSEARSSGPSGSVRPDNNKRKCINNMFKMLPHSTLLYEMSTFDYHTQMPCRQLNTVCLLSTAYKIFKLLYEMSTFGYHTQMPCRYFNTVCLLSTA